MIKLLKKHALFLLLFLLSGISYGQTTLIYSNSFEVADPLVQLNVGGVGSNSGPNQWIINKNYVGQPTFPNTISEDSTTGGSISHPDSNYLHIYDSNISSVSNANFDPNDSSDRFTTIGPFCTQGFDSVHIAFFVLCVGNINSQGSLYYSTDGGATWKPVAGAVFSGISKWKYEDLTDTGFSNQVSLEFGFRWANGISTDTATSFGIDDINIVGSYDPVAYPVHIHIDQIYDTPVCEGSDILFDYYESLALCGQGIYDFQLSAPGGSFSPHFDLGSLLLNNNNVTFPQFIFTTIPANAAPDSCYRIRIVRTDVTPPIVSDSSACFIVKRCPAIITTGEPIVVANPQDTLCLGSVIDIPFTSAGAFLPNNHYIAQLSDSSGNFTGTPNVLGSLPSDQQYGFPPGSVAGLINATSAPIPPGCNYFIRIISTSPQDTGSAYGPICIRDCDIETNQMQDIQACVTQTTGQSFTIPVGINTFDSSEVYAPTDTFKVQVLSTDNFSVLNTGGLGYKVADTSTVIQLNVPGLTGLASLGLIPGVYYIRVVATNSNEPWNTSGTLIRLTIGSPNPTPLNVFYEDLNLGLAYSLPDTTICVGGILFYQVDPYNSNSNYQWTLTGNHNWATGPATGIIFLGAGPQVLSVLETNFGCAGPGSDTARINVIGPPPVNILGPNQVCVGDSVHYSVPLADQTYYKWTSTGSILDTANNNLDVRFPLVSPPNQKIVIRALGLCGLDSSTKTITVKAYPVVDAGNDTTVCQNSTITLSTPSGTYTYLWNTGANTSSITVTPDTTTNYSVSVKVVGPAACTSKDTVTVFVQPSQRSQITDSICPRQSLLLDAGVSGATYMWNTGATTQTIAVHDTGSYMLTFKSDTALCNAEKTYTVRLTFAQQSDSNVAFCPGSAITLDAGASGSSFYWSTGETSEIITVHDTGVYAVSLVANTGRCIATRIYDLNGGGCLLHFANVITPNGDGLNDTWSNTEQSAFDNFDVKIVDRWGLLIYESTSADFKWDGKNKQGKVVPDGVYYYIVNATSGGEHQEVHGFITVLK